MSSEPKVKLVVPLFQPEASPYIEAENITSLQIDVPLVDLRFDWNSPISSFDLLDE